MDTIRLSDHARHSVPALGLALIFLACPALAQGLMLMPLDTATAQQPVPGATIDANSSPTVPAEPQQTPLKSKGFLGFPDKVAFHRFSGWAAGGSLLAAGLIGGIHFLDMMSNAHAYRDSLGIDEFDPAVCPTEVERVWGAQGEQALRWTHVALLSTGELFYLANAVTGTGFMGPLEPGWSKSRIHRYAFYAHAALMVSEIGMGLWMSDALSRGDHQTMRVLGAVHAGIGVAIPVVILGAGAIMGDR